MTMAALEDLADDEVVDEDEDEEDGDLEDAGNTDEGTEVGGGDDPENPDGDSKPSGTLSSYAQLQALLQDPEVQSTLTEQVADYQARMAAEAASTQEAEALQKMIADEDWEGVGKAVVTKAQQDTARTTVKEELTREMFSPVYADLFKQPEMQTLTAEDRERLHVDKFPNNAAHVAAVSGYIAEKRFNAQVEAEVTKRVATAIEAEKNKDTSVKAKAPSLAGRTPAAVGVVQPKLSSADLIRSGLRGIIGMNTDGDDDS